MTTIAFDTLKFAQALKEKAHLTTEQAEGFASAIADALHDDLATKADLKIEIEAAKSEIIKWMFGTIGFQTVIILGAVIALARTAHP
ncbi:MAG: hypothetical protein ABSD90_07315 [Methylocystis sp.]|jgi:hypothetical protein